MNSSKLQKYILILIPVLFLFYSAPSALDYLFFHADEKRYTDAVVFMMEKGDCFTPYQADGETPRFKKPIITYWVLMSGFRLFGISPFGARLFFWLTGALLVLISYFMAYSLFKNRKTAVLTAFIVASNPLVLMSASRTIPDILLVTFLTVSAWGFIEIMVSDKPARRFYWMAYLGAALAFETKGIPAAAFAGLSMLFLAVNPWRRVGPGKLLKPLPIVVSLVVALSWFIIMYVLHGSAYLDVFFADQVGERVSSKFAQVFGNGMLGIVNLVLFFVPWVLMVVLKPKKVRAVVAASGRQDKAILGFILGWILLIVVMAASVFKFYDRYILPGIPLIAMALAYLIDNSVVRARKAVLAVFGGINLVALLLALGYQVFISFNILWFVLLLVIALVNLCYFLGLIKNIRAEVIIANLIMMIYFSGHVLLSSVLMPVPAKQLVVSISNLLEEKNDPVYVYGHIGIPANVRVQSGGALNIVSMDSVYIMPANPNHLIAFKENERHLLDLSGYDIYPGSETLAAVPVNKFPGKLVKLITDAKKNGKKYLIGKPRK
ncbi:phospholipid carrier-dependent glycosyltransferase [uncultured Draconibacterium sp.]|uniref:ArnT family glycosyltransferase n=1 Tax=uncultured Draconibacterium sp. TaxID=1573823 RepID=UPI0025F45A79|nr:phospholipid carrier-dependent glycosyltransferase [uncultured Draconibacterium sp.]